jgi:hypothetical protein
MDESEHQARCIAEEPANELEKALAAVLSGETSKEDFLRIFIGSNVYVLVNREPRGDTLGDSTPMVLSSNNGPHMLALFSSPIRSLKMTELFPDYRFTIMVDCAWALHILGTTLGIALNPGCDLGFELAPDGAQQLKRALEQPPPG